MIPYFEASHILLGQIVINVWGLMVALGIIAGTIYASIMVKKLVLSEDILIDSAIWMLISAFIFARIFHVMFYNLDYYLLNRGDILKFWEGGLSSTGGFFGAVLGLYIFSKVRHLTLNDFLPYFDVMSVGLWLGWGIGRIGCFLIHDHPGTLSNSPLAVNFPGGARFDLGLFDSILGFAIFSVFAVLLRRIIRKGWGYVTIFSSLTYAVGRFFLDFLRAADLPTSDVRYASLTPAQWGMLAAIIGLTVLLFSGRIRRQSTEKTA